MSNLEKLFLFLLFLYFQIKLYSIPFFSTIISPSPDNNDEYYNAIVTE